MTRFQKVCISFKMANTAYFSFHNQMINTVPRKKHTQPQMLHKFKHHIHTLPLQYFNLVVAPTETIYSVTANCVAIINNGSTKSMIRHYLINNCQFQWHIKTTFLTNLITTLPKVHKSNSNYWTYREQKHTYSQTSTLTLKFQHM